MGLKAWAKEVFTPIDKGSSADYVKSTLRAPKSAPQVALKTGNHAYYIGKMHAPSWTDAPGSQTYSADFIRGALAHMFEHAAPEEHLHFVVGRELGDYCNGSASGNGHLSLEDEMALIYRIAEKEFPEQAHRLKVSNMRYEHTELFEAMEAYANPDTGQVDLDGLFDSEDLHLPSMEWNALNIANLLYTACQKLSSLKEAFQNCVPEALEDQRRAPEDQLDPIDSYALFEVAIRLTDLIRGRQFQGGVDRQVYYDRILVELVKGKKGRWGRNLWLAPLFEQLEGKSFRAMHVSREKNFYTRKRRQTQQRVSLGVGAIMASLAIGGPSFTAYKAGQDAAAKRDAAINEMVTDTMESVQCFETGPFMEVGLEWRVQKFNFAADQMREELIRRYPLTSKHQDELMPFIRQFLISHKDDVCDISDRQTLRMDYLDRFVLEHQAYFVSQGIETGLPYANLREHQALFEQEMQGEDELIQIHEDELTPGMTIPLAIDRPFPVNKGSLKYLGPFNPSTYYYSEPLELYVLERDGKKDRLLVKKNDLREDFDYYSSLNSLDVAGQFFVMLDHADMVPFHAFEEEYGMFNSSLGKYAPEEEIVLPRGSSLVVPLPDHVNSTTGEVTHMGVTKYFYKEEEGDFSVSIWVTLSCQEGKNLLKSTHGAEVAAHYKRVTRETWHPTLSERTRF